MSSWKPIFAAIKAVPDLCRRTNGVVPLFAKLVGITRSGGLAELRRHYKQFQWRQLDSEAKYAEWIRRVEPDLAPERCGGYQATSDSGPLVTFLVPVLVWDERGVRRTLESVSRQDCPRWNLVIAVRDEHLHAVERLGSRVFGDLANVEIVSPRSSEGSDGQHEALVDLALRAAKAPHVAILSQGDMLSPVAVSTFASVLEENNKIKIVYTDEDLIGPTGTRIEPFFKGGWNRDLFYSTNYIGQLCFYRRASLEECCELQSDGVVNDNESLIFRMLNTLRDSEIGYIPRVLYHRSSEPTIASDYSGLDSVSRNEAPAQAYFRQHYQKAPEIKVGSAERSRRLEWPSPSPPPLVSLIIPTRDKREITELAVRSIIEKTGYSNFEILIVDNGSVEAETKQFFENIQKECPRVRVEQYDFPFNYSAINNFGVRRASGSIIGLVNNDVEVINPGWLDEMVRQACRPDIGCVGAKLHYSNDTVQHAGVIVGVGNVAGHSHRLFPSTSAGYHSRLQLVQNVSAVTGACLVVRREIYEALGGLDEENLPVAYNDVDFCLRVREAGYRNLWTPYAELYHHESISRGCEDTPEKKVRYRREMDYMHRTWPGYMEVDPYYSPHLSRTTEDFSIASIN